MVWFHGIIARALGALRLVLILGAAVVFASSGPDAGLAETGDKRVMPSLEEGFGRIILTLPEGMRPTVRTTTGVVVIQFPEATDLDVSRVAAALPGYVSAARRDPDNRGVRFALAVPLRVNTMEAANKLVVDFLPSGWQGLPPGLPIALVEELKLRAENAAVERRRQDRAERIARAKPIEVRMAQLPTFTRLSFIWPDRVGAKLSRDGSQIVVTFEEAAKINLGQVRAQMPEWIEKIDKSSDELGGLRITMTVAPEANVRGFHDGASYVVDVTTPAWAERNASLLPNNYDGNEQGLIVAPSSAESDESVDPNRPEPRLGQPRVAPGDPVRVARELLGPAEVEQVFVPGQSNQADASSSLEPPGQGNEIADLILEAQGELTLPDQGPLVPATPAAEAVDTVQEQSPGTDIANSEPAENVVSDDLNAAQQEQIARLNEQLNGAPSAVALAADASPDSPDDLVQGDQQQGIDLDEESVPAFNEDAGRNTVSGPAVLQASDSAPVIPLVGNFGEAQRIAFDFDEVVPAAIFLNGPVLWMVFDTNQPIVSDGLLEALTTRVTDVDHLIQDAQQILRLTLSRESLLTATADDQRWTITLGERILEPPSALTLTRSGDENGFGIITIPYEGVSKAREVVDPDLGLNLWVVTGTGVPHAVLKSQQFVEFATQRTAQGIVVRAFADDIRVKVQPGQAIISGVEGLSISGEANRSFESAAGALGDVDRPGYVHINSEELVSTGGIAATIAQQSKRVSALPEENLTEGRLRLARLYLAADLAAEGIGMLQFAATTDPAITEDINYQALLGVGEVMMGRFDEALRTLDGFEFRNSPDVALWRGLAHAGLYNWAAAEEQLMLGEPAIPTYGPKRQMQMRIALIRSALESGDVDGAARFIDQAQSSLSTIEAEPELLLLFGWLGEQLGRDDQALDAYERVLKSGGRKLNTEAKLRKTNLEARLGVIEPEEAINRLEGLSFAWRGDRLELLTLQSLASLQVAEKQYRRAFETMKHAAISDTGSQVTREIEAELNDIFKDLYLGGRADELPPVEALALFYDFRELTPVGREGDEMIRALADRLIDIDLLGQAAQLLEHQVENRLTGSARAQIAAKLALVHLMNREPEKALTVLSKTRQAVLPDAIQEQRIILESRALAETGRSDLAVELLDTLETIETQRMKADALWHGEKWQEVGEAYEKLVLDGWSPGNPLNDAQAQDIVRAAIGYALAGDELGAGRIRATFANAMSNKREGSAFAIIAGGDGIEGETFKEAVSSIAAIDTLDAFLTDYKARYVKQAPAENS